MRPKGFKNPHIGKVNTPWANKLEAEAFEAGAAEYERCLKKEGLHSGGLLTDMCIDVGMAELNDAKPGVLVFIPEEE